ncbi:MAG: DUF4340 domain-containing protein [Chloroflexi bacterium]|nr:DUF4340 domain-containing protein [Chloroflexota bacterium]
MNPRVTVGLLAVLLALVGYTYFGGAPPATTAGGATPGATSSATDPQLQLLQFDEQAVGRLTVQRGNQQTAVERTGDGWTIQPSGQAADRLRVNSLVFRLANLRATRRFPDVANLAEYGLDTPATTVTISQASGPETTLLLGARAPAESGTYVKRADDSTVYVVTNAIAQDLERLASDPPLAPSPTPDASPSPGPLGTPSP